ncbi:MAG: substrate-binding domain-containing protein [Ferrovum myxofaciens]
MKKNKIHFIIKTILLPLLGGITLTAQAGVNPPWSEGRNNPVVQRGLEFTVPEVDNLPDFHGDPMGAQLSIFVGGNYFFAMAPLVTAFEEEYPALKGKIYYETIPPGLLFDQIHQGGTITVGNMTWTVKADVYAAGLKRVSALDNDGLLQGPVVSYATNQLAIMVPKNNPAHIQTLSDLGKPGVKLVMPNPEFEGIGRQIKAALMKAGGPDLVQEVYVHKVHTGETQLTHIHHRQSPMTLMKGLADAGVTWQSEAIFQEETGNPITHVEIPATQNATAIYAAGVVKGAPHPQSGSSLGRFPEIPQSPGHFCTLWFQTLSRSHG